MSKLTEEKLFKITDKHLKIQLIDNEGVSFKHFRREGTNVYYELIDETGENFGLLPQEVLRVSVRFNRYTSGREEIVSTYYVNRKDSKFSKELYLRSRSYTTENIKTDRVEDVLLRPLPNLKENHVDIGTLREFNEINHLFKEELVLDFHDLGKTYISFKLLEADSFKTKEHYDGTIIIYFYRDDIYIPIDSRSPNYAGSLKIFYQDKGQYYGCAKSYSRSVRTSEYSKGGFLSFADIHEKLSSNNRIDIDFRRNRKR